MLLISGASQKLQIISDAAGDIEVVRSVVDRDASGVLASAGLALLASITAATTTDDVVPAVGANKERNITGLIIRNTHASVSNNVTVRITDGTNTEDIAKALLLPGETLALNENGDWIHTDSNGGIYFAGVVQQFGSVLISPFFSTAALTSTKTITSGSAFAVYVGKATKSATAVQVRSRVTTAMATITWGEVAIAKGAINLGGNPTLTVVGFADVSATFNSTGQKSTTVNVSSGQSINPGDDLWIIIGNAATTAAVMRAASIADDLQVGLAASVASRPSTIVGTPTAFTIEGAATLPAWVVGLI